MLDIFMIVFVFTVAFIGIGGFIYANNKKD